MNIYHLGFPARTYLASKVFNNVKIIEYDPHDQGISDILAFLDGDKEFLFHLDLSVQDAIPAFRAGLISDLQGRGITVHNARHTDQRKRLLQKLSTELGFPSLTAPKEGDPDEKLLVKTDLNVGGGPERRILRRFPKLPMPQLPSRVTTPFEYYPAKRREIADEMWADQTLHIERCIENSKGWVLRTFWNQGNTVVSIIENPHEIVKKRNEKCKRWNYAQPVDEFTSNAFSTIRTYGTGLDLSFFAADFVVNESGSIFLTDLNLTPQWVVNSGTHVANMTPDLSIYDIPDRLKRI